MGKLVRMRESLWMPNSSYKLLKENEIPENLKESLSSIKNRRFTESDNEGALKIAIKKLSESTSLEEKNIFDKVIKKLKEEGASSEKKLWKFPVSRFGNLNGNGRIYSESLWQNVINNQRDTWQGGCGLADHPLSDDDPGQFKTSAIVWLDMIIDSANKLIWAIGTFVGEYGRLAQEIIEAGGRIGFSSSGFGELLPDGQTVDPDSYIIERVADIVTNPSQSVYGDISSEQSYNPGNIEYNKQTRESLENSPKSKILERKEQNMKVNAVNMDTEVNNSNVKIEESNSNVGSANHLSKIEKKVIEKQVESMINDTDNLANPMEKLSEVNDLLKLVRDSNDEELYNKVHEKLEKTHAELTELVESATKLSSEFGDLNDLSENTKKNILTGVLLNDQVSDYKELCEALTARNRALAKENNILKSKLALRDHHITKSQELAENTNLTNEKLIRNLKEKCESVSNSLHDEKRMNISLMKGNRKLESDNGVLKTKINSLNKLLKTAKSHIDNLKESNKELLESNNNYKSKIIRLQSSLKESEFNLKMEQDKFQEYKEMNRPKYEFKPNKIDTVSKFLNLRENAGLEVENYWNDLVSQYGDNILPFERQIRGAKTYREAFSAFMKYLPRIDESAAAAKEATMDEGIGTFRERQEMLSDAGAETMPSDIDEINKIELEKMKKMGLM